MKKERIVIWVCLMIFVGVPIFGRGKVISRAELLSEHPAVKTAVQESLALAGFSVSGFESSNDGKVIFGGGNGNTTPLVSVRTNQFQYESGETMEINLDFLESAGKNMEIIISPVRVGPEVRISNDFRGVKGFPSVRKVISAGESVRIQNYIWDGTETQGMYVYSFFVFEWQTGRLLAMVNAPLVFERFVGRAHDQPIIRIDSAEYLGNGVVRLKGNVFGGPGLDKFLVIKGKAFSPIRDDNLNEIYFQISNGLVSGGGRFNISLVVKSPANFAYDSANLPDGLRIPPSEDPDFPSPIR